MMRLPSQPNDHMLATDVYRYFGMMPTYEVINGSSKRPTNVVATESIDGKAVFNTVSDGLVLVNYEKEAGGSCVHRNPKIGMTTYRLPLCNDIEKIFRLPKGTTVDFRIEQEMDYLKTCARVLGFDMQYNYHDEGSVELYRKSLEKHPEEWDNRYAILNNRMMLIHGHNNPMRGLNFLDVCFHYKCKDFVRP